MFRCRLVIALLALLLIGCSASVSLRVDSRPSDGWVKIDETHYQYGANELNHEPDGWYWWVGDVSPLVHGGPVADLEVAKAEANKAIVEKRRYDEAERVKNAAR